jgi:hypothetical protein
MASPMLEHEGVSQIFFLDACASAVSSWVPVRPRSKPGSPKSPPGDSENGVVRSPAEGDCPVPGI